MSADPVLKPESFQVEYQAVEADGSLLAKFSAEDDRILRVGVNSSISSLLTIVETMDELDEWYHSCIVSLYNACKWPG